MQSFVLTSHSVEETRQFGRVLGRVAETGTLILLSGDLGAGKTSFTQGLGAGLDIPEDEPVVSPSYTLMNHYQGRLDLFHFDLYRLSSSEDLDDIDFDSYLDAGGVTVVEWCDRVPDVSRDGLLIRIEHADNDCRRFFFEAETAVACKVLQNFSRVLADGTACS